jgi:hypothetical protein
MELRGYPTHTKIVAVIVAAVLRRVGMARVDRVARVAKGSKPHSALSAASTPVRGALIVFMIWTSQAQGRRLQKSVVFRLRHRLTKYFSKASLFSAQIVSRSCPGGSSAVSAVDFLRDDTLGAKLPSMREHGRAVLGDVLSRCAGPPPRPRWRIGSQQPGGRPLCDCVVIAGAAVVERAGSVIERPHGLHWVTYKFSANARLMTDKVIGWPQIGHATPSLGVGISFMFA